MYAARRHSRYDVLIGGGIVCDRKMRVSWLSSWKRQKKKKPRKDTEPDFFEDQGWKPRISWEVGELDAADIFRVQSLAADCHLRYPPQWSSSNARASRRTQAAKVSRRNINIAGLGHTGNALISPLGVGDSPFLPEPFETPLSLCTLCFAS